MKCLDTALTDNHRSLVYCTQQQAQGLQLQRLLYLPALYSAVWLQ
jgi:hypothetical protein